jgi:ribokinase
MTVLVFGSINSDLVLDTPRLPASGETIRATNITKHPGGKGANQAVAASRMGADVAIVGRVGNDPAGSELIDALNAAEVNTASVTIDDVEPTGMALITVAEDGSNTIVTAGGANHRVGEAELAAFEGLMRKARIVLVQLEVPIGVVDAAVAIARAAHVPVILDPAPVAPLSDGVYRRLTWITPNEHEATALTGLHDPAHAAADLRERGVEHVVVTLGDRGAYYLGPRTELHVPAPAVAAVDTVACGDAFNGALAASLAEGREIGTALRIACAAGAAAATTAGAYPSLATKATVGALLDRADM